MYTLNAPPLNSQLKGGVESLFRQIHELRSTVGHEPPLAADCAGVRTGDVSAALTLNELENFLLEHLAGQSGDEGRNPKAE